MNKYFFARDVWRKSVDEDEVILEDANLIIGNVFCISTAINRTLFAAI